jgi:hypothetical protein
MRSDRGAHVSPILRRQPSAFKKKEGEPTEGQKWIPKEKTKGYPERISPSKNSDDNSAFEATVDPSSPKHGAMRRIWMQSNSSINGWKWDLYALVIAIWREGVHSQEGVNSN